MVRFVADSLDDKEGKRTRVAIPNYHGIVKYEVAYDQSASEDNDNSDPRCIGLDQNGICLLPTQIVDIDNCWLTVSKTDLETASGELEITAYNQAMLTAITLSDMGPLTKLLGLEKYNGPTNMRIENKSPTGFRLAWDLPESESCFGAADIVIILTDRDSNGEIELKSFATPTTATYFDFLGLNPEVKYNLGLQLKAKGGTAQVFGEDLSVVTRILLMCALAVAVLFVLTRRGIINIQPQQRMDEIRRAVTKRVRQSRMFATDTSSQSYKNRTMMLDYLSELYLYGGMDFNTSSKGYISRNHITFDVLLKSGHFANIYRARYNGQNVVAKSLKENFTTDDELLMNAKINFSSDRVGDHPNFIKFIGAVVDDVTMGPMIIYEFRENKTLRDYIEKNKSNMTVEMQENLFRFGLDIAKGMDYLTTKGVTHRRLAARNILLNHLNEVKIAGFGPQTAGEEDGRDAETGKKVRLRTPYTGKSRNLPQCLKRGEHLEKPGICDETTPIQTGPMQV
ncbi:angiopoietin-1 receptor-like [Mya arenaria]|uniref:angiopoietin-1 receptor-like n=1 Tax=Mya arenaria TaxID=6604 RepID=UPI0022E220B6|nr:angiopoietin-1 receptor-like [Mya arenaria]